jgi:hypothetical protein
LTATPDRYRVTYPQVFGLIDYILWLLYLLNQARSAPVTAMEGRAAGRRGVLPIPLGTFMPYFHEDGVRGYVVVPGFFSPRRRQRERVRTRRTFSDVLALVQDMVALARLYLPKLLQPAGNLPAVVQELVKDPLYVEVVTQIQGFAGLRYGIEFDNFYHPLVCPLRKTFYARGIDALMARGSQLQTTAFDFGARYQPTALVEPPLPRETVEFGEDNAYPVPAYAGYNWELFFHLPLAIAVRLTADQQFEKALAWFHYIFNPMDASSGSVPQKYWRTKPFFLRTTAEYVSERIDSILNGLDTATGGELDALKFAVEEWRENPYQPFRVARARTVAFQQTVLMKYLDNLVKWGDSLFIQGTMESVNQATQLYVMADKLLGPRPRIVPPVAPPPTETYNQLAAKSIDAFGNAMLELENLIPDLSLLPHEGDELPPPPLTLSSLYFCIPPNPTLLQLWDTVADRLFKIRHCQDINGVERVLALFAPPIDPGALVAAAAAGLSPAALLAGLSAPLPFYRFTVMATKAAELAQMVSSLGASLLAVLEKRDAETLARLRATQEIAVQGAMIAVRQQTLADAEAQLDVLQKGIDLTKAKAQYYRSRPFMNEGESSALNLNQEGLATQADARSNDQAAAIANLVPTFSIGVAGFGGSATFSASYGGSNIASSQSAWGQVTRDDAAQQTGNAQIAATLASYQRRQDDWTFQADLADKELTQLASQVVQAKIRVQVAAGDLAHQKLQLANAKQSDAFLRSKFTGKELYEHELGLLAAVYFAAYQLVLGVAHKAERCFQVEIGSDQTFIDYAYWDSQRKGLLAGERLLADIRKMEVVYLEQNRREYELTKNVSLAQLDPRALLSLQHTGACTFSLPEAIFDAGHPGHYFRRLRTVSLTVPCVSGPYTQVSCKLSLVGNRYRKNTTLNPSASQPFQKYVEVAGNDPRFVYNVGTIQSIATSQGQNDAGLFQVDFRDERYLPFERQGAISSWRLELPQAFRQFDYRTITDVVLNIKYTARDGGSGFRALVEQVLGQHLQGMLVSAQTTGLNQGFNVRLEYADAWHRLQQTASVPLTIGAHQLPFFTVGHKPKIAGARWLARVAGDPSSFEMSVDGSPFSLTQDPSLGNLCTATSPAIKLDTPFTLAAAGAASLQELSLVVNYTLGA